ncbi:MAG: type II toxin-antitoxin system VapC family toxin [Thermodesulfobacteriota bacterium]|nr:type II toxin-antitoxin system VapC family toxin [Thermodesulfobacteriota bacterium]
MPPLALLDTDTLSEIMKGKNASIEKHAREYLKTHGRFRFSVITRYEILRGLKAKQAVRQIAIFEDKCNGSYIYPVTDEIVVQASDIYAFLHRKGLLISDADILIASTAMVHHLTLITGNVDHFTRIPNLLCESWKSF